MSVFQHQKGFTWFHCVCVCVRFWTKKIQSSFILISQMKHCKFVYKEREVAHKKQHTQEINSLWKHQFPNNAMSPITANIIINAANGIINLPLVRNSTFDWCWKVSFNALLEVCCLLGNKLTHAKWCQRALIQKLFCGHYYSLLFMSLNTTALSDWAMWMKRLITNGPNSLLLQYQSLIPSGKYSSHSTFLSTWMMCP